MKRVQITDKIDYVEPEKNPLSPTSAGIIISSSPGIVIDTSLGAEDTAKLLEEVRPEIAIISHYHIDHTIWGCQVQDQSSAELYIPQGEEKYLTNLDYFIEKTVGPYNFGNEFTYILKNIAGYKEIDDSNYHSYTDSTEFKTDSITIECVRTPGHSPSHSSFYFPDEKILFSCDLGIGQYGPWYGWEDCDIKDYINSILLLKSMEISAILTSHDGIIKEDIGHAFDQCLSHFFKREQFIKEKLDRGKTKDEIVEEGIYYRNKSKIQEPMKTVVNIQDSIMFDHHKEILGNDSLGRLFPELKTVC